MKKQLLAMLAMLAVAFGANAQKIEINEFDRFTKELRIETTFEKLVSDNMTGKNMWVKLFRIGDDEGLRIKWVTGDASISLSQGNKVIFLDDQGEPYEFLNSKYTTAGKGEGTLGFLGSAMYGLDLFFAGSLDRLKGKTITEMRIYTNSGYMDFTLKGKRQNILSELYKVFEKAKEKHQ